MDAIHAGYAGSSIGSPKPASPTPGEPSILDQMRNELTNLEEMAARLANELNIQADRLLGPVPCEIANNKSASNVGGPADFLQIAEQISRLRSSLCFAQDGARRLRKIG